MLKYNSLKNKDKFLSNLNRVEDINEKKYNLMKKKNNFYNLKKFAYEKVGRLQKNIRKTFKDLHFNLFSKKKFSKTQFLKCFSINFL